LRTASRYLLVALICGVSFTAALAECPGRPLPGTIVQDALNLSSQNGELKTALGLSRSVDEFGYTHYCFVYEDGSKFVEAPTLRLNQQE
jgi:hypothetical protein